MKEILQIHPRVQVVIYDGQAPHPRRRHWVVLVDNEPVWHQSTPANRKLPQPNCLALAKYIAQREVINLSHAAKES